MGAVDPSRAEAAKRFAKAVAAKKAEKRTEATGTVVKSGGSTMVRIDGAAMPTPCDSTVTLNDGDRVTVKAENHRLVITGNLTNNAIDQNLFNTTIDPIEEKTNCIAITADGIEVGDVKYGRWVGTRVRMGNHAFSIIGEDGQVLAEFDENAVDFQDVSFGRKRATTADGTTVTTGTVYAPSAINMIASMTGELNADTGGSGLVMKGGAIDLITFCQDGPFAFPLATRGITINSDGVHVHGSLYVNGAEVGATPPATEEGEE